MGALRHADWQILSGHRFRRRASVASASQVFRGQAYFVLTDRITVSGFSTH
jgi:hypothetical protein